MGRKRRAPGDGTGLEPHKFGLEANEVLGELADRFADLCFDIGNYALAEAVVLRKQPEPARVQQGFEAACEWAARTVFEAVEKHCGADKARRIFARASAPRKSDKRWEKQKQALRVIVKPGQRRFPNTVRGFARWLAENPHLQEHFGMSGSRSVEVLERRLHALKKRWKKEQARLPKPSDLESKIMRVAEEIAGWERERKGVAD